jgi:opacity protein-like surface antigen
VLDRRTVAALILALAALPSGALAQAPSTFAGLRFGPAFGLDKTGRSLEVLGGVEIASGLHVTATLGRINDLMTSDERGVFARRAQAFEAEFDRETTIAASRPAVYTFGGLRWSLPNLQRVRPFVEGGGGVATVRLRFDEATAGGVDLTDLLEAEFEDELESTRLLLTAGGGVNLRVTRSVSVDVAYRWGRIAGSPSRRIGLVYGGGVIVWP